MARALVYRARTSVFQQLQADLKSHGWMADVCDGMLEMLRLIDRENYEVVVLNADRLDMEAWVLVGTIEALKKKPKILLSLPEESDFDLSDIPAFGFPVIRGALTSTNLMEAAREG